VTTFTAETYQNEYLPDGGSEVNAIITVTASGAGAAAVGGGAPEAVELILLDCSGSMEQPHAKMLAARQATCAAIDTLRDGVWFGVIHGTGSADMI
jgi:hypothetical protein